MLGSCGEVEEPAIQRFGKGFYVPAFKGLGEVSVFDGPAGFQPPDRVAGGAVLVQGNLNCGPVAGVCQFYVGGETGSVPAQRTIQLELRGDEAQGDMRTRPAGRPSDRGKAV